MISVDVEVDEVRIKGDAKVIGMELVMAAGALLDNVAEKCGGEAAVDLWRTIKSSMESGMDYPKTGHRKIAGTLIDFTEDAWLVSMGKEMLYGAE